MRTWLSDTTCRNRCQCRVPFRPRLHANERAPKQTGGHRSHRVVWAIAVLCVASGCSSGSPASSSSAGTSIAPSTSTSVTSLAPSVTTTTVATTTTTTSTTIDPSTHADEQVRAAYQLASDTYSACLVAPAMPHCDTATLAVTRAGALLDRNVARIDDWQSKGYTVRNRDKFRSVVEQVTIARDAKDATLISCIADGSSLVLPGAGPSGADVIIDGTRSHRGGTDRDFVLDPDGVWRAHDGGAAGPTQSTDVCPAS